MTTRAKKQKTYNLDGTLLEACSCMAPCPCGIGEDPDEGSCDAFYAYHIDQGQINGVDVSGLTLVEVAQIPGNILAGNWRLVMYVDDRATAEQQEALLHAFGGKSGGPLADLARLIGEVVRSYPVPIEYRVEGGKGILRVGEVLDAEMAPYVDATGKPTTIHDTVFSTIPGSPAYVAKASHHRVNIPEHGMTWELNGRNAIQSNFHFEA
ncbi:MAG TPA: DUF1326 domain-containing protein [Ktedonobacteraceae bacterium]